MRPSKTLLRYAGSLGLAVLLAGGMSAQRAQPTVGERITVFENARLILGDSRAPIERSAFIIQGRRVTAVGRAGELTIPAGAARVDLAGKTVMPAIVDTHSHPGYVNEVTNVEAESYFSHSSLLDTLDRFAYTGHALTYSLGSDMPNFIDARYSDDPAHFVDLREESDRDAFTGARYFTVGRGLAWPGTGNPRSSTFYPVVSPWLAVAAVRELHAQKVTLVKLWLEDRNGFKDPKSKEPAVLTPDSYQAAIKEAHRLGMHVIGHVKTLKDWKGMIRAGIDATTHTVEDTHVDDELLDVIRQRPGFVNVSALTSALQGGSAPRKPGQRPEWLADPLLTALKCPAFLEEWGKSFEKRPPAPPDGGLWSENTVAVRKAGATIIMGSHDAGQNRVFGWGSHMEMEAFVNWIGMTPQEAIASGTSAAAKFLGVADRFGTIDPGKSADFIVLDANPLDDIRNTRKISQVYLRGKPVNRAAMKQRWQAACAASSTR